MAWREGRGRPSLTPAWDPSKRTGAWPSALVGNFPHPKSWVWGFHQTGSLPQLPRGAPPCLHHISRGTQELKACSPTRSAQPAGRAPRDCETQGQDTEPHCAPECPPHGPLGGSQRPQGGGVPPLAWDLTPTAPPPAWPIVQAHKAALVQPESPPGPLSTSPCLPPLAHWLRTCIVVDRGYPSPCPIHPNTEGCSCIYWGTTTGFQCPPGWVSDLCHGTQYPELTLESALYCLFALPELPNPAPPSLCNLGSLSGSWVSRPGVPRPCSPGV